VRVPPPRNQTAPRHDPAQSPRREVAERLTLPLATRVPAIVALAARAAGGDGCAVGGGDIAGGKGPPVAKSSVLAPAAD